MSTPSGSFAERELSTERGHKRQLKHFRVALGSSVLPLFLALTPRAALAAGDVQVSVANGNLIIRGDSHDNNIIVTENSVIGRQMPDHVNFSGGAPSGFPGDGLVEPTLEFAHFTGFEFSPDDCSFLGGRF